MFRNVDATKLFERENFVFEKIGPSDLEAISPVAVDEFILGEPVMLGIEATADEFGPMLKDGLANWLKHGLSFCAREAGSGKIVGVSIATILRRNDNPHMWSALRPTCYKTKVYIELAKIMEMAVNVFDDPSIDVALEVNLLCVLPEFRKRGIATALLKMTMDEGRGAGCDVVVVEASSLVTQTICSNLGFETKFEYFCKDFKWEGQDVFDLTKMNGTVKDTIMMKPLS